MLELWPIAAAYLIGSIPFGLLLARWFRGVDVRTVGSGNIGATNVTRMVGWKLGLLTLLLDALKGSFGSWLALGQLSGGSHSLRVAALVAPIAGHCFSPWLRFKGGKGVATALGVVGLADPRLLLVALSTFVLLLLVLRFVAIASIGAALAVVSATLWWHLASELVWGSAIASALIVIRHHGNIRRLWAGTEPRVFSPRTRTEHS